MKAMDEDSGKGSPLGRISSDSAIMDDFKSVLGENKRKFVERAILVAIILIVVAGIFAPVGVLIEEFLSIESGGGGSFD